MFVLKASQELIYDSSRSGVPLVEDALELFHYRDLLISLVRRDLTVRYKRSVLGFVWTMLNPLLTMLVLTVVFSSVFRFEIDHYGIYLLSGLLLWNFFSQSTTQAMHNLVWGGGLVKKIHVPTSVFVFSAVLVGLVNFLLALVPLGLIMLITGQPFAPALVFLPIPILLTALFALGIGLFLAALAVFFVDILDIYQVALTVFMYLTPLIYPLAAVPPQYLVFIRLNPIYYFVEAFRTPIYQGRLPDLSVLGTAALLAIGTCLLGWWFFTSKANEFAYRI